MRLSPALLATLAATTIAGCAGDDDDGGASGRSSQLNVVATTQHVADFARQVAGDRAAVTTLIPANADPHDFEPRPSDARAVAEADVVLQSGGDIDAWLDGLVESAGGDAERLVLLDAVRTIEGGAHHEEHEAEEHAGEEEEHEAEEGAADPHWWQDPRNVELATRRIGAAFAEADPAGKPAYDANANRYVTVLRVLDADIASCMRSIPAERRKLVTVHDAYGYFAARYDIEVLGSIIPALSTNAQPSAGEARRLVAAIRRERVRTIFAESAVNRRLEQAIARDAGAEVSEALYGDTLGPGGDATYVDALRHDAAVMADGFGGDCTIDGP